MKHKLLLLLWIIFAGINVCVAQTAANSYIITGHITGLKDPIVYFNGERSNRLSFTDSVANSNGDFIFKGSAAKPYYALIYTSGQRTRIGFYVQNGFINVTGNIDSLNRVKITGSSTQIEWDNLNAAMTGLNQKRSDLEKMVVKAKAEKDTAALNNFVTQQIFNREQIIESYKQFVIANPKSYVSPGILLGPLHNLNYEGLFKLYNNLDTSTQHTIEGEQFYNRFLAPMSKTAIGKPAIIFTQNNVNGKPVNLADYKGKYVLIDFWASWCGPCRDENPNLLNAYNKYKSKGFNVLGISLDDNGENWKKAVAADKLQWAQVSSLNGWKNEAALQYSVHSIPANFLIDPNGIIIAHNLSGEDLDNKLAEILK